MSPRKVANAAPTAERLAIRIAVELGIQIHDERARRGSSLQAVARRARVTDATVQRIEAGGRGSIDTYARLAVALGLTPTCSMTTPRAAPMARATDAVHAGDG